MRTCGTREGGYLSLVTSYKMSTHPSHSVRSVCQQHQQFESPKHRTISHSRRVSNDQSCILREFEGRSLKAQTNIPYSFPLVHVISLMYDYTANCTSRNARYFVSSFWQVCYRKVPKNLPFLCPPTVL